MPEASPDHVHGAIEFVLATHLLQHGADLHLQGLAPPQQDCQLCTAILAATGLAHELAESAPTPPRRRGA